MSTCKDCKHWMGNIKYDTWECCEAVYDIDDHDYYRSGDVKTDCKMILIHNKAAYDGGGDFKTHKDFGCISFTAKSA